MPKYFISYGNYIHTYTEVIEDSNTMNAEAEAGAKGKELCRDTLYTHGFEPMSEEEAEELSEAEKDEMEEEYIESENVYYAEVYDPETHDELL